MARFIADILRERSRQLYGFAQHHPDTHRAALASRASISDHIAMIRLLDSLGYQMLIPLALILGLAPFVPEPHLVEKIRMLIQGTLQRPIDIFDLVLHAAPIILLIIKVVADLVRRGPG